MKDFRNPPFVWASCKEWGSEAGLKFAAIGAS